MAEQDDSELLERRAPVYELAFEEAGRALDAQERAVNELRSRAGVLWPRDDWQFSADPAALITRYAEPVPRPIGHVHRDLALHRTASVVVNGDRLRLSLRAFRVGVLMLLIETGSWLVALASGT